MSTSNKHIHILGICGTFMGGIAVLAKQRGFRVTGQDANVYPPMSLQLEQQGIELIQGYDIAPLQEPNVPDMVVIGNALSRGNSAVEYVLNHRLPYTSGAQWLAENVLYDQWVLAVAGTHGKTTTSSMLAWILEYAGLKPGFLIGGVPENFSVSARESEAGFFVVEADEYDTAFFDKRSKFIHYHPRTAIINNIEFDHGDIFTDLEAIKTQFHYFVRTIPGQGLLIYPKNDQNIQDTLKKGLWTPQETISYDGSKAYWNVEYLANPKGSIDGSAFKVFCENKEVGVVKWSLIGKHNVANALVAIAAARHVGIPDFHAVAALNLFKNVKRRMELKAVVKNIAIYDDFAHHPTAIATTLDGLRNKVGKQRIMAILEPRSNTMKMQLHNETLADALTQADFVFFYLPCDEKITAVAEQQPFSKVIEALGNKIVVKDDLQQLVQHIAAQVLSGDHLLVMSNGGFGGIHQKIITAIEQKVV